MPKKPLAGVAVNHVLSLLVAGGFCVGGSDDLQAAEKKSYTKPPSTSFASQMPDALLGSDKYEKPVWNLHDALNLPKWLSLSVEQRSRYETMDGTYKANAKGGDQQIPLQTDVWLQATLGKFRLGAEFLDARALGADSGSGVNNTHADQADFLQGYAAWADQNLFYSGIGAEVIAGRQTLNFGSRRLVARNNFRNTVNSFTGARLRLADYKNWQFNGFVTMPVLRYPAAATDITRNQTRNRRYFTPGMRLFIKPAKSAFDFQLEAIGQLGTVRATTAVGDGKDLQHQAWYQHIDVGYTFAMPWTPRLALEYDYAGGDSNPNDGKDQRFDTLYGARRFDYGPTGIYGAFARSNINSPGYRINVAPRSDVQAILSHRVFWLASATDAWTTSGLQDKTGRSGDFVGHQLDLSTRWDVNSSLNLETGWAHLFKGEFAKKAPSAPNGQDIDYFYVQSMIRF